MMKSALLMSGGMDSTSIAYWKRPHLAITVDYGQLPAPAEIRASTAVCEALDIEHMIVRIDLSQFGSGDLAGQAPLDVAPVREWWPYRNQAIVTIAAMATIGLGVKRLLIGSLRSDAEHSDGTEAFVRSMSHVLRLQEGAMVLEAPAIGLDAVELARKAQVPMEVLAWSHSCHVSDYACGECGGCRKHYRTMEALGAGAY